MNFVNFAYQDRAQQLMRSHGYSPVLMTLVIATIPERTPIRQEERYRPLVDYLSGRMGDRTTVSLKHLPSYEVLVDEFKRGGANAAFFGSFTYALAKSRIGVEPVARPENDGNSWYRGLIFVRKDSGIDNWTDLRGKRFSMIKDTTAGDVFPRVYLKRHGVESLEGFFGGVVHAGSHDTSVRKVLSGEVEAGAAKDLVYARLGEEDPRVHEELKILAESRPVPDNALVIRSDIHIACISCHQKTRNSSSLARGSELDDLALGGRLRQALIEMDQSAEGRRVLELFGADRFVETTDADYEDLYDMIEELGLDLSRR
jgi:phosphonate transport system substrate-binding protein